MQIESPDSIIPGVYDKQLSTVIENMLLVVNAPVSLETN
jgi:hypothetical protein